MTNRLRTAFKKFNHNLQREDFRYGTLGWVNPDTGLIQYQPLARPDNYVYVTPRYGDKTQPWAVENRGVPYQYDLPVKLQYDPSIDDWYVSGTDPIGMLSYNVGGITTPSVQKHSHGIFSGMEDFVEMRRLWTCLVTPGKGMVVNVSSGFYYWNNASIYFPGGTIDLTSYIPGSVNTHAWVLVEIDPNTNLLTAVAGSAISTNTLLTPAQLASLVPVNKIPLAGIDIANGDTAVIYEKKFLDPRPFLTGMGGGEIDYYQKVGNNGTSQTQRSRLNFIPGTNITYSFADNPGSDSTDLTINSANSGGTVTSVALSMPAIFSVSGSPITSSGTLAVTLANESANQVFAGPTSGGAAVPTFRALVAADIPSLAYVTSVALTMPSIFSVSGSPITSSGTFAVTLTTETANTVFAGPTSGGAATPTFRALVAADIPALAYVTSVALSMPSIFSVSGSPITSSGTFTVTLATETANTVWAGPTTGAAATPTFRALVSADIPALAYVTSVALSMPAIFSVSGSPITSSGTFTVTLANENANLIFSGPASGAAAAPTFRNMDARDITDFPIIPSGRLGLSNGVYIDAIDITAQSTIYYNYKNYSNDLFPYFDGTRWNNVHLSGVISVAVPSTVFRLFDIFGVVSSGTLTLETVNWSQTTGSITGATNATPISITSVAHGRSTGDVLGFSGLVGNTAPNGFIFSITKVDADHFTIDGSKGNGAWTSGGTWYAINAFGTPTQTALTTVNGVTVKNADHTRIYLGTGCTGATSGQMDDSAAHRMLWNQYNRIAKPIFVTETTATWTISSATLTLVNHNGANTFWAVSGQAFSPISLRAYVDISSTTLATVIGTGIGKNTDLALATNAIAVRGVIETASIQMIALSEFSEITPNGFTIYPWLESASTTSTGNNSGPTSTGLTGQYVC